MGVGVSQGLESSNSHSATTSTQAMQQNDAILVWADCCDPCRKVTQRNIERTGKMSRRIFLRTAHIDHEGPFLDGLFGRIGGDHGHAANQEKDGQNGQDDEECAPVHGMIQVLAVSGCCLR